MVVNYAGVEEAFKVGVSAIDEKDKQKGPAQAEPPHAAHKYDVRVDSRFNRRWLCSRRSPPPRLGKRPAARLV